MFYGLFWCTLLETLKHFLFMTFFCWWFCSFACRLIFMLFKHHRYCYFHDCNCIWLMINGRVILAGGDNPNKHSLNNTICNFKSSQKFGRSSWFLNQAKCKCCRIPQKNSWASWFLEKSPDPSKSFVFLPKQALLELSAPVRS